MTDAGDDPAARARRLTEPGAALPPPAARTAALGWALKDLCYQCWNTDPPRAVRAAEMLAALLEGGVAPEAQPLCEALAPWTAGIAALIQGHMADAVSCFERAAAAFRQASQPDLAAQTEVPKIMALAMLGRDDEAAACGEAAQRELRAHGNLRAAARVSQNLAGMLLHRDRYREAAQHYREASVLFARLGEHEQSVLGDIGLADALAALGDFDEALRYYARARMRAGNQGLERALALVDGATALLDLTRGRYREALAGFESARRRFEALGLASDLAVAEKHLADAYVELRLLPEAWALLDRTVGQFRALESPGEEAAALAQRGRTEALLGRAAADASFSAAAVLFEVQGNEAGLSAVTLARAELALARADAPAALALAKAAAAGFTGVGQVDGLARADALRAQALLLAGDAAAAGALFTTTLASARQRGQMQVQVRCLTGQGLVAKAGGDAVGAHEAFEAAIELFEVQRAALPGDELRSAFLADHLRPYLERLRAALDSGDAADTLHQLERFRARSLAQRIDAGGDEPADESEASVALRERLNWLYRRLQRLHDEGESSAAFDDQVLAAEHELLERARRRRLMAPASTAPSAAAFSTSALQAVLRPGDAVVAFGVLDDELFACVVRSTGVRLRRRLASWASVLEAAQDAAFQLDALRHGATSLAQHLPLLERRIAQRLARLHGQLWAPLADALDGCGRVLVVPHGTLGALPFAALTDGTTALGQLHDIAIVPSAQAALRGLSNPPLAARRVLAVGESTRLAHAADEARAVAAAYPLSRCFVGAEATLANLRAHAGAADVLHLACHGQFRGDNPRFSALHLHDGALGVELAERLDLPPCTVVLGACETGLAEAATGNEMVGLVRAFLIAGASRVVASQWPVDDAVTARFMQVFHGALAEGVGAAPALRAAQATVRQTHPHPHFWAAFALYGGW